MVCDSSKEYSEEVAGTDPEQQLRRPSLLDRDADNADQFGTHSDDCSSKKTELPPAGGSSDGSNENGGGRPSPALLRMCQSAPGNASNADVAADDAPPSPPSQQTSQPAPVTDHKPLTSQPSSQDRDATTSSSRDTATATGNDDGDNRNFDNDQTSTSFAAELQSFDNSWPAFLSNMQSDSQYGGGRSGRGPYRTPHCIAMLLGPRKEINFIGEREQWESDLERRKQVLTLNAAGGRNVCSDAGMERVQGGLRADERFRRNGERMQRRHERWLRGECSDEDDNNDCNEEEEEEEEEGADIKEKLRRHFRKKVGNSPTIAELAVLMGLLPAQSIEDRADMIEQDERTESKQTLLAPPDLPYQRGWQSSKNCSSPTITSASRHIVAAAAAATAASSSRSEPDIGVDTTSTAGSSSIVHNKRKKKSSGGAGTTFFSKKKRRHRRETEHRLQPQMTMTQSAVSGDEADADEEPVAAAAGTTSGPLAVRRGRPGSNNRLFERTPSRVNAELTQTSLVGVFSKK